MIFRLLRFNLCVLALLLSVVAFGVPVKYLVVYGKIADNGTPVSGALVKVYEPGFRTSKYFSDDDGLFKFKVKIGDDYKVEFYKEGYASKKMEIITRNVNVNDLINNPEKVEEVFIDMFPFFEELDITILEKPIARIVYSSTEGKFTYDYSYNESIQDDLGQLKSQVATFRKNGGTVSQSYLPPSRDINMEPVDDKIRSQETFYMGTKEVQKTMVANNGRNNEFWKVQHEYGATFYFKNGQCITKLMYDYHLNN